MDFLRILSEFDDFYLKTNNAEAQVTELTPNPLGLKLPLSYQELLSQLLPGLSSEEMDCIISYIQKKNKFKGYNFKANNLWYSIEYKECGKDHFFHLYSSDRSIKNLEAELVLAQLDPLSGLLHKNAITTYIKQELENPNLSRATIFMIDIDYFKNINDNYGHVFGDQVIVEVSRTLKSMSKRAQVGRVGGDEFMIFLEEGLDRDGVKNIARLIRYLLDKIVINGESFPITATIGITQYPVDGTTFEDLYRCCDKALYRGKQKGRDCHIVYDPALHEKINSSLPKTKSNNVNVLSIGGFIKTITDKLIEMPQSKMEYDKIFKLICNYFNLDRIVILDEEGIAISSQAKKFDFPVDGYAKIDLKEYISNFVYDNMYMMNDTITYRVNNAALYDIYKKSGVKSFVQVLLFGENELPVGFISYEVINERRVWQTSELNYLVIISNLIKGFFQKQRNIIIKKS